ncbi:MAG: ribonuclease E inhibitor RraB [Caulobacteraceae bacterium]|nr:ribonuclease E inhibitor RraB [Caulobacteraceae bacterium]
MFANMKAHTAWDLNGDLLWGYYFTAASKPELEEASKALVARGYRLVEVRPLEKASAGVPDLWQLHVERVEHHTPESLLARNEELYALAAKLRLNSYDGMDVGPAK